MFRCPLASLMLFYHVMIGIGEAIVTSLAVAWLLRRQARSDLRRTRRRAGEPLRYGRVLAAGLTIGIAIAVFAAPFASDLADGLDTVAGEARFRRSRQASSCAFPDYALSAGSPVSGTAAESSPFAPLAAGMTSALGLLGTG